MKPLLSITLVLLFAALLFGSVMAATTAVPQASILVNSTADDLVAGNGTCTLREAIMNANNDSDTTGGDCAAGIGADLIDLPAGTYTLTIPGAAEDGNASGDLDILDPAGLTIQGAGAETTIIDGNQLDRVLHLVGAYEVEDNPVAINDLTIANGHSNAGAIQGGAGILNDGADITIRNSVIRDNTSESDTDTANGGGLLNINGQATLINTVVRGNEVVSTAFNPGGGIYSSASAGSSFLKLIDSQVLSNTSSSGGGVGAITESGSTLTVTLSKTMVSGNLADGSAGGFSGGGGLFILSAGITDTSIVNIQESTIKQNQAFGDQLYSADGGGALFNGSQVLVERSSVISNTASGTALFSGLGGGMFFLDSATTVVNSTFSGNEAIGVPGGLSGMGGGIVLGSLLRSSSTTFINTTIASNTSNISAGGLSAGSMGLATGLSFVNTLIANNQSISDKNCGDLYPGSTWESLGYNLEDADTCHFDQPTDQINTDPLLAPLQDNGGPTWTHALPEGSPALDSADSAVCATPPVNGVDQRGVTRPQGAGCDIGAFELEVYEPITGLVATNDSPTFLGQSTTLTATIESGTDVSYAWDFGDGTYGSGAVVNHTYPQAADYVAVVTASNPVSELSAETTVSILELPQPEWRLYLPLAVKP